MKNVRTIHNQYVGIIVLRRWKVAFFVKDVIYHEIYSLSDEFFYFNHPRIRINRLKTSFFC